MIKKEVGDSEPSHSVQAKIRGNAVRTVPKATESGSGKGVTFDSGAIQRETNRFGGEDPTLQELSKITLTV